MTGQAVTTEKCNAWSTAYGLVFLVQILAFTGYAFFNAQNMDAYGERLLYVFFFLSLPWLGMHTFGAGRRTSLYLLWGYLGLALASCLFPPSNLIDTAWLLKAFPRLLLAVGIVLAARSLPVDRRLLRYGVSLTSLVLSLLVITTSYGVLAKTAFSHLTPFPIVDFGWNDKYFNFWQVFLIWGSVAFLWRQGKAQTIASVVIFGLGLWAIFLKASESAQIAIVVSLVAFALAHGKIGRRRRLLYLTILSLVVLIPLLWVSFAPLTPHHGSSLFMKIRAITSRMQIYDFCSHMIRREFLLGYGFGSALHVNVPDGALAGWNILPGGHPHNFVFLIFFEHGIVGWLLLTAGLLSLFDRVYDQAAGLKGEPAVWAFLVSGEVIFSLSFAIWQPDIVLMYMMFFALFFAVLGQGEARETHPWFGKALSLIIVGLTILGAGGYLVGHFLHRG